MAQETWTQYVTRISGGVRNVEVARQVGISESTVTRWRDGKLPTPSAAVAVARAYGEPALEALVIAGYLTTDEMSEHVTIRFVPLSDVSDVELANELLDRAEAAALAERERRDDGPGMELDPAAADEEQLLTALDARTKAGD